MIDWILNFRFNGMLGIFLYWLPLVFCIVFYTVRSAEEYVADKAKRDEPGGFYVPSLTIGALIGRALASLIPIVNIWAGLFDLAPRVFSRFFGWIGKVFDQPLVPDSEAAKARRKSPS